jgi:DNA-binding transcriptional LysR family regulator
MVAKRSVERPRRRPARIRLDQDIGALPPGWKRKFDKLKMSLAHNGLHMVNVKTLDLNLVRIFDALMEDHSVRRAGQRLGVTQSAVSHALNRLRYHLNDELLIRTREGMIPTARAVEIAGPLRQALRGIDQVLGSTSFEPLSATRRFVLAANDMMAATVGARLMSRLAVLAPGIDLVLRPVTRLDLAEQIDMGLIDLALGVFAEVPARLQSEMALPLTDVAALRPEHPVARSLSAKAMGRFPLAAVSLGGVEANAIEGYILERGLARQSEAFDRVALETALAGAGTRPRFGLLTPHFMALPPMLASSELIAIVPDLLTPIFRGAGLVVCPLPYKTKPSAAQLVWHRHASADAANTWFRSVLLNIARECVDERA